MVGGIGGSRNGVCGISSSRSSSISSSRGSSISSRSRCCSIAGVSSVGGVAGVDGTSVACVRGAVVVDARGIGGNGSSSGVGVAGSNSDGSNGGNSNRSSRSNSNWGNRSNWGSSATSRDDKEVGSGGVAVGDGLVLSSNGLLKRSQIRRENFFWKE